MNPLKKELTIYDIARKLNISPATVSRGLNNHPSISKKTKKRVIELARKLGYRSNTFASNLRRQRTNTIGVIVPKLNSNFMSTVLAGIEKVANESGYNLIISQSLESVQKEIANTLTMFNSRVDGLLVSLAFDTVNTSHFDPFIDKGIPVLFFDRVCEKKQCVSFVINNHLAGYEATAHLIKQGCSRIVHITGNLHRNVYADRLSGYKMALKENGISGTEKYVMITDLSVEAGVQSARRIMSMDPRPDGIFVANDMCAISCMMTLKKAGPRIPDDIAVVGFNNDPVTQYVEPNLTTVNYPGNEMGKIVARNLINHLSGDYDVNLANQVVINSELVVRESSLKTGSHKK